jgi:CRP-like cAMP-binding protein
MNAEKYASLTFFKGLDSEDLYDLFDYFSVTTFVAGTVIFEQGDQAANLYIVAAGEVAIRYKPEDGPMMTVTRVQPGDVFGWSAMTGNGRYTSGAICSLDSEILSIPGDELKQLCQNNPRVGNVLMDRVSLVIADRQKRQQGQDLLITKQVGG